MTAQVVFLAGASGAIGKSLVPQLVDAGHIVFGTTRSADRARELKKLGATPVVVDVFDPSKLSQALREARPSVVMHQVTDLPKTLAGSLSEKVLRANSRLRDEGTRNLIDAALAAKARRFIAQSLAWVYAPGPTPHVEDDPLNRNSEGTAAITSAGIIELERMTLNSPPLDGVVSATVSSTGPVPGTRRRTARRRYMWTPRRTPRCSRSRRNMGESITSRRKQDLFLPKKPTGNWAGALTSACAQWPLRNANATRRTVTPLIQLARPNAPLPPPFDLVADVHSSPSCRATDAQAVCGLPGNVKGLGVQRHMARLLRFGVRPLDNKHIIDKVGRRPLQR